ncbi:unnamed protein product [Chrysoparadoxa australica]
MGAKMSPFVFYVLALFFVHGKAFSLSMTSQGGVFGGQRTQTQVPAKTPALAQGARVVRNLRESDVDKVLDMAFDEFVSPERDPELDLIGHWYDRYESALLRWTVTNGFLMRIKIVDDHVLFCTADRKTDECIGLAEVSMQPANGSTSYPLPLPLLLKKVAGLGAPLRPYISNVLVDSSARRSGVARELVKACEDQARRWGYKSVYLHVEQDYLPAARLYYSLGYEAIKRDPWWHDLFDMPKLNYMKKVLD